jgi:hypothetical protein
MGCLLASIAEFSHNCVEDWLSKDTLTYPEAKERILNLGFDYYVSSCASTKNSMPQPVANVISSLNEKLNKKKNSESLSSFNFHSKECQWC